MITVNSISGGKTSSYMAAHYPADKNVFALIRLNDPECAPTDKALVQRVSDKLGDEFIATAEDDLTLYAMFDLEQLIGREITWISGKTFDRTIKFRKHLPNQVWRYCTREMKLRPIQKYSKQFGDVVMNIGFRFDEKERGDDFKVEQGWRSVKFPLITDRIGHYTIYKWVQTTGLKFPPDSNCVFCFWKSVQQLRKNFDTNPKKMAWAERQERKDKRWKKEMTYTQIKNVGLQADFNFEGGGAGCQAGFCHD